MTALLKSQNLLLDVPFKYTLDLHEYVLVQDCNAELQGIARLGYR